MLDNLLLGFSVSLSFGNLVYCFFGCLLGTIVGILPGIGPGGTIVLLLPFTQKLDVTSAIIMLSGIYYGVAYGGTLTSVLMNIPGEVSTIVTCIDGYQMARKGRAGPALGMAAFGSFFAGTLSVVGIMIVAPPLASFALSFGPAEFTALMVGGLALVTYLSSKSYIKSLIMAVMGLILGCVGLDPVTGAERFTFGSLTLLDGVNIAPLAMGIYGIGEVLAMTEEEGGNVFVRTSYKLKNLLPTKQDWKDSLGPIGRGSLLGFFLGLLPGGGAVLASFLSYGLEKRISKHPEKFGQGAIEGVAGPESANNSGTAAAFIPLLILGLPFNVVTAFILIAFMMHGVTPGPFILTQHPEVFWGVVTSMYIGNVMLLILNLPMIGIFVNILRTPYAVLAPLIAYVCFVGGFAQSYNPMDVLLMVFFGFVGYLLRKFDYEPAPLLLAYVLGPMLERAVRQSLILSSGNPNIFIKRPMSLAILSIVFLSLSAPFFKKAYNALSKNVGRR
jgi:putative tricarboxylic transport membrane protein